MAQTDAGGGSSTPPLPLHDPADTLIFRVGPGGLILVGGSGRGAGWSGIVDVPLEGEELAAKVHGSCRPVRVGSDVPVHVVGPYWARHAIVVPVGAEHLVVFGSDASFPQPDSSFLTAAALMVADLGQISPAKLLADELELVHAIRDLMDYRPESIAETARHIAAKTAEPLSCEVGAVLVRHGDDLVAEVITRDWPARLDRHEIRRTLVDLFERAEHGPVVEREISAQAGDALGREQGLVARYALPIGRPAFGVLVVAHASTHARGFTNLCQRIGHALAEAAETLLVQAMSREGLAADRDRFAREARIDPLTGLENRAAWEELLAVETARLERHSHAVSVVSADLDNLKAVNDQAGHATGDRLIRAAADLLRRCSRGADRIARVGGDEFLVLLPDTDAKGAAAFMARVDEELPGLRVDGDTPVALSLGTATARLGEPLADVVCRADQAMYSAKRQRLEPAS